MAMDEKQLLHILENNARISEHDLALMLNESEADVRAAIADLEKRKVIVGYHTVINYNQTKQDEVMAIIEVNSVPERGKGYDRVANMICQYPEVKSLQLISGTAEFLVMVSGSTMQEISDFVGSKLAPLEGVRGTSTIFVLKNYKRDGLILEGSDEKQEERLFSI